MNATGSEPNFSPLVGRPRRGHGSLKKLFKLVLAIALLAGTVIGARRLWQSWQDQQLADQESQVDDFYSKGDLENAIRVLGNVIQGHPRDERALRLWARILQDTPHNMEDAVAVWRKICGLPSATANDYAALGSALLRAGRYEEARDIWTQLSKRKHPQRAGLELEAALLRHDGKIKEADQALRRAYEADLGNPDSRLKLAALDLESPFPEIKAKAARAIWEIARGPGGTQVVSAMQMLASMPNLTVTDALELRKMLTQMPQVTGAPRYAVLSGCLKALPLQHDRMLDEETARHHGKPGDESAEFFYWLLKNRESSRILRLLDRETALHSGKLFPVYAEALNAEGRWKDLQSALRSAPPISPASAAIMLAFCSYRLGEPRPDTLDQIKQAMHEAHSSRSLPELLATGTGAEEMGFNDLAVDAFKELSQHSGYKMSALDHILEIRRRQDDLPQIIATLQTLLEDSPGLEPYQDLLCYHKILAGEEIEKTALLARRALASGQQSSPTLHLALALAAYRFRDLETAQHEASAIAASDLPAGQRAVLAGIFEACGQTGEAFRLAEKIAPQLLLAEENRFLRGAL